MVIEHILSGENEVPQRYVQAHDEWVTLLAGAAVLDADGQRRELARGDWAFLPAAVPHVVVATTAGTSWLAVHVHAGDPSPPADPTA